MYRHLYQMRISDETVNKLEQTPGGIMPMIRRIENEYGVKTLYHRKKHMVLISPSEEVLELAQETLESRYVTDDEDVEETEMKSNTVAGSVEHHERRNIPQTEPRPPVQEDLTVHTIHNRHYSPTKPRGHSISPARSTAMSHARSIQRSSSRSPEQSKHNGRTWKRVVFA